MKRHKRIDYITDKLGELKAKVEIKSTLNLTDINLIAEDFYCHLFNLVYGYDLVNTNFEQSNSASIDLGDVTNRIAFQITSTKTPNKVKDTVSKFIKNKLYKKYDRLIIFNIVKKSTHREKEYGDSKYTLDTKNDIWDYKNLTRKINSLDDTQLCTVHEYFVEQFDNLYIVTRRIPNNYKMRIKRFRESYLGGATRKVLFGGREEEIESLNLWLMDINSAKNILITSPAGRGKTALLIHWMESISLDWLVCFMPISIRYETNQSTVFFESLACQLAGVLDKKLTAAEYEAVDYYKEKIAEYIELIEKSDLQVLIVIDGLDEVTGWKIGENLFPRNPAGKLRVVMSARILSDKNSEAWANQLDWEGNQVKFMEIPLLSEKGVEGLLINSGYKIIAGSQFEHYVAQLFRLTSGEPLLLNLYITDLLQSSKNGKIISHEDLSKVAPGFEAYFKKWMNDQETLNNGLPFNEEIKTLLAIFSCAMGPIRLVDLEEVILNTLDNPFYLESDKLLPIQRFLIGDGTSNAYALSHPLFGIYLREEFFKNNRRIQQIKISFLKWGALTISKLESDEINPKEVSPYLLQFYRQHLNESSAPFNQVEKLLCNGWRKAHLQKEQRHLGFVNEIEQVILTVEQEFSLNKLNKNVYISALCKCVIFSASINNMGKNMPPKLRHYAIEHDLMTVGQSIKQIDTLENSNKAQSLIAITKFLNSEQIPIVIDAIGLTPNIKNRRQLYLSFAEQLNSKQRKKFISKLESLLEELDELTEEPELTTSLSELIGNGENKYSTTNINEVKEINDAILSELEIIKYSLRTSVTNLNKLITTAIKKFDAEKNISIRMSMIRHSIVNLEDLPPIELVNIMTLSAKLLLKTHSNSIRISDYQKEEAQGTLILGKFIKLAIENNVDTLVALFNKYLHQLTLRVVHYQESNVITDFYQIIKNPLSQLKKSKLNKLETNILTALNKQISGNNRTHSIVTLLPLLTDNEVSKDAVNCALIASELIEDELSHISFLTALADITTDCNFRNSTIDKAFNIACSMTFLYHKLSAYISIIKVNNTSTREKCIETLKHQLKHNCPSDDKIQFYWQLCELIDGNLDDGTYEDILNSLHNNLQNWTRLSWIGFNCIKKFLKLNDQIKFFYLASQDENDLDHNIRLLEDICFEEKQEYVRKYSDEISTIEDSSIKCNLLSLLGKASGDDTFIRAALLVARNLSEPYDKLQAYMSIDRHVSKQYFNQIFELSVCLLNKFDTKKEYRKSLLLILSLNGRTAEFMSNIIDEYAYSEAYEFKIQVFSTISSNNKRPASGDAFLVEKLIQIGAKVLNNEDQVKIFSNIFSNIAQQNKLKILTILLKGYSKTSRSGLMGFIIQNLPYLYEIGGEKLLINLEGSSMEAAEWWP